MYLIRYQDSIDDFVKDFKPKYFPPFQQMAHLYQEFGELARAVSHDQGMEKVKEGDKVPSIPEELADVIATCIFIANSEGFELDPALRFQIEQHYPNREDEPSKTGFGFYQQMVRDRTSNNDDDDAFRQLARLGEKMFDLNRSMRGRYDNSTQGYKPKIAVAVGHFLVGCIEFANSQDIDIDPILTHTIEKKYKVRDKNRYK